MLYPLFLLVTALEMLWETRISSRNSIALKQKGAVEISPSILWVLVVMYIVMYIGSFLEYEVAPKEIAGSWALIFGGIFLSAKGLKFWAVGTLGPFWTMRVLILPQGSVVTSGPYRFIRHPNYVAVWMEVAAIPLLGKSFVTFLIVFLWCAAVLFFRIKREEEALMKLTDYSEAMKSKKRFFPA